MTATATSKRPSLRLGLHCDNRCIFCAQRGLPSYDDADHLNRLTALRATSDTVTFVGGEPGLLADLPSLLSHARGLGFRAVGIQTNGHRLEEHAELWAQSGLTDVHVSLHGADAAVHDYHTGVDGSYVRLVSGIARARAAGLTLVATTVLTRSNCRVLGTLPRFLQQRGVAAWMVSVPTVAGEAADHFDRVVPRLGLAMPFVLHALDAAQKLGLPAFVESAPLCLLGPFANRALPSLARSYAPACDGCEARPDCPGVDARYLARFGGDELRPRHQATLAEHPLASLFVGVGETAATIATVVPASPAEARRSLPLYGKVQPAAAEAARTAPRQSGEALRTLFPALFTDTTTATDEKS